MDATYNPNWRFANMSQTEIEDSVKTRSSVLLTRQHIIPESSGKKIKFRVTEQDIEHLVSDALHRSKGVLFLSDISELPRLFKTAKHVKTDRDTKNKKKEVWYYYYELNISGRIMYLNIMEDKVRKTIRLHSITTKIQTTATKKQRSS